MSHPTYREMIDKAISDLKERDGSSRQSIIKYINACFTVGSNAQGMINKEIRKGIKKGYYYQPKGTSGSIKMVVRNRFFDI